MSIFNSDADRIKWKLCCRLRVEADRLGQSEMAKVCGTSQSAINRALNQNLPTKIGTMVRYLDRLGIETKLLVEKSQ